MNNKFESGIEITATHLEEKLNIDFIESILRDIEIEVFKDENLTVKDFMGESLMLIDMHLETLRGTNLNSYWKIIDNQGVILDMLRLKLLDIAERNS